MSLDIYLEKMMPVDVYSANITHNLGKMAEEAGIYGVLWRPEENNINIAGDLILLLEAGIIAMKENPDHFKKFDSPNGWGMYVDFLPWLEKLLEACREHPEARLRVWR